MSTMVPRLSFIACISFLLHLETVETRADVHTAIASMELLLNTHKRVIDELEHYIVKDKERISLLKRHLDRYKLEHKKAMEDVTNYLDNPINAFTLTKRLTTELYEIEDNIKIGTENIINMRMDPRLEFPTLEDLEGAAQGLARVQITYNLSVQELSQGVINGVQYSSPMSAEDCYNLARTLYHHGYYENTIAWVMEALNKLHKETRTKSGIEIDLLEFISYSHFLNGNATSALEWSKKLLTLEPEHPRVRHNVLYYAILAKLEMNAPRSPQEGTEEKPSESKSVLDIKIIEEKYKTLCRGEMKIPSDIAKRLKCRYLTENHPFLRLAPLKVEQVYISPDVFVFHEVISDEEIKVIQNISIPKLRRATISSTKTGQSQVTDYRVCKVAWVADTVSATAARVTRRVRDMTGLSAATAEPLQVVNYGIGGHYLPHHDYSIILNMEELIINPNIKEGDSTAHDILRWMLRFTTLQVHDKDLMDERIATVLFYMSDVAEGGATVFPLLGLSVFPVKNTALYWTNLLPTGEGDLSSLHAACPVLRGSKWVTTKWLHEGGQELLKPCNVGYKQTYFPKFPRAYVKTSGYYTTLLKRSLCKVLQPALNFILQMKPRSAETNEIILGNYKKIGGLIRPKTSKFWERWPPN